MTTHRIQRAAILMLLIVALCVAALWLRGGWLAKDYKLTSRAPFDVIIDGMPWCAQHIVIVARTITIEGAERGVCTSKNVRSTQ